MPLPLRSVIKNRRSETGFQLIVRRQLGRLAVPFAPIYGFAVLRLIRFDHLLRRAAFTSVVVHIAVRNIVVIESMIGTRYQIVVFENRLTIPPFESILVLIGQRIDLQLENRIRRVFGILPAFGIKHRPCKHGPSRAARHTLLVGRVPAHRQYRSRILEVRGNQIPGLGGRAAVFILLEIHIRIEDYPSMPFGQLKIDECAEKTGLRLKFSILFRRERGMLPHGFQELIDTADTLISTRPRIEQVARRRHRFRRKHIIIGVSGLIARNVRTVFESFGKSLGQITLKLGGAELSVTVNIRIKTVKVKRRRVYIVPNHLVRDTVMRRGIEEIVATD